MRILLINVDCRFNLAIRRMYAYFIKDNEVEMRDLKYSCYPHKKHITIDATGFDRIYVSNIFEMNKDRVEVINCPFVEFGGIGSNFPENKLPDEIESTEPFYFDSEDTSYGFLTRGCIRNCWFCKVPKNEGKIRGYNDVDKVVKHKKAIFLDNNILAYDGCCDIFRWLIEHKIKCEFNQGLDFRLVNDENLYLLSQLKYTSEYTFAFDDPSYKPLLNEKIGLMKKYIPTPWKIRFFVYYHPDMSLEGLIDRIEWCRKHECKPYMTRDIACWGGGEEGRWKSDFLKDIASYCNQPQFFKKQSFEQYLINTRYLNMESAKERVQRDIEIYNRCLEKCKDDESLR